MAHSSHSKEEYEINAFVCTSNFISNSLIRGFYLDKKKFKEFKGRFLWGMKSPKILYLLVKFKILFSYYRCIDKGRI